MGRKILYNGKITGSKIKTGIESSFVNAGAGFFETLLYEHNRIFFLDDHVLRLARAAEVFDFRLHTEWIREDMICRLVRINHPDTEAVRIKIICAPVRDDKCWDILICTKEYERRNYDYSLFLHWEPRDGFFCNFKPIYYFPLRYWRDYYKMNFHADEVAFTGINGRVLEAASANILFVKDRVLHHVDIHDNYLSGVMQKNIINHADSIGFNDVVAEKGGLALEALKQADEIILVNSLIVAQRVGVFHTGKPEQAIVFDNNLNWAGRVREYFLQ